MGIREIFKKPKKEIIKPKEEKVGQKEEPEKEVKPSEIKDKKIKFLKSYNILKSPHVTERATDLIKQNQYIFKVWPEVNKPEVKKAVENLYGVNVLSVKIINVPSKIRRLGKIKGQRKGYKKAIVKIREDQKIEVLPR